MLFLCRRVWHTANGDDEQNEQGHELARGCGGRAKNSYVVRVWSVGFSLCSMWPQLACCFRVGILNLWVHEFALATIFYIIKMTRMRRPKLRGCYSTIFIRRTFRELWCISLEIPIMEEEEELENDQDQNSRNKIIIYIESSLDLLVGYIIRAKLP
eukprot:scaffold1634_cov137-Amphora_coffeaeformis.AAC.13